MWHDGNLTRGSTTKKMYFSDHRIRSLNNINQSLIPFTTELATEFMW